MAMAVGFVVATVVFIITLVGTQSISNAAMVGLIGFLATLSSGHAPDVDLSQPSETFINASRPFRYFVKFVLALAFVISFAALGLLHEMAIVNPVFSRFLVVVTGLYLLKHVPDYLRRAIPDLLHRILPEHRGLLHELSFWVVSSTVIGIVAHYLLSLVADAPVFTLYVPIALGVSVLTGSVTHISADTIQTFVKRHLSAPVRGRLKSITSGITPPVILDLPRLVRIAFSSRAHASIRALVVGIAAYGLLPVDVVPDALLGIGYVDDISVYLLLRRVAHAGYRHDEGVLEATRREWRTLLRLLALLTIAFLLTVFAVLYFVT